MRVVKTFENCTVLIYIAQDVLLSTAFGARLYRALCLNCKPGAWGLHKYLYTLTDTKSITSSPSSSGADAIMSDIKAQTSVQTWYIGANSLEAVLSLGVFALVLGIVTQKHLRFLHICKCLCTVHALAYYEITPQIFILFSTYH